MIKILSKITALLLLVFMLFSFSVTAFALTPEENTPKVDGSIKVHDLANLYTGEELEALEQSCYELSQKAGMDFVIVTTDDALGKDSTDYASDFYDYNDFGIGKNYDGVVFVIDLDNRDVNLVTTGSAIRAFTDRNITYILDEAMKPLLNANPNYYGAAVKFVIFSENVIDAFPAYKTKMRLTAFASGIGVSAIIVIIMWFSRHRSTKLKTPEAHRYIPGGAVNVTNANDIFVSTYTRRTPIPKTDSSSGGFGGSSGGSGPSFGGGSSTSRSSSGRSHGGGRRSF